MVSLVRQRGAWIANLAGLFAVIGLSTLPGLVLLDYFSVGVEQVAGVDVAFDGQTAAEGLPGFAVLMAPAFATSLLAVPVALLALWRAGLVAWWLPVVSAATFVAPNLPPWVAPWLLDDGRRHAHCVMGALAHTGGGLAPSERFRSGCHYRPASSSPYWITGRCQRRCGLSPTLTCRRGRELYGAS